MKAFTRLVLTMMLLLFSSAGAVLYAQAKESTKKMKKASSKVESGLYDNKPDTVAQGYFELGESYYQKGELQKSEQAYQKSKTLYELISDADGIAKSSRALAKVQEALHKDKEAIGNYRTAAGNTVITGDRKANAMNKNDISRLSRPDSLRSQADYLQDNINLGKVAKDTVEIVSNYEKLADVNLQNNQPGAALNAFSNAYQFSRSNPEQAVRFNQSMTDALVKNKDFTTAIATKKGLLNEPFVQNSTQLQASEITSLADIYLKKEDEDSAIVLLKQSYNLSIQNGHTLEAKKCVEKLDSVYMSAGEKDKSLGLYKDFLTVLPTVITKDSSLTDNKIIAETEDKLRKMESEKALKDALIKEKNILNYWLIGSIAVLLASMLLVLVVMRKLKTKNKKIALQSLRREMNPHFIFNSLNSINQYIANNNELEANQYLTKFSTLMRRVMENSKEDFVLFSKELELLQNYLELERSRFTDKFDFRIDVDDVFYADEQLKIPGMLVQPYLENAVWHGLRYMDSKGLLQLSFQKLNNTMLITIEDNGIGIEESKKSKTANQKKHSGRGITNTLERIRILNELYHQHITCVVEDKPKPASGVIVKISFELLKNKTA